MHKRPSLRCIVSVVDFLPAYQERATEETGQWREQLNPPRLAPQQHRLLSQRGLTAMSKHNSGPFLNYLASKLGMLLIILVPSGTCSTSFASAPSTVAPEGWMAVAVQLQLCRCNPFRSPVCPQLLATDLLPEIIPPPSFPPTQPCVSWLHCSYNHSLTCFCEDEPGWLALFKSQGSFIWLAVTEMGEEECHKQWIQGEYFLAEDLWWTS